jgi:hypothetical protein
MLDASTVVCGSGVSVGGMAVGRAIVGGGGVSVGRMAVGRMVVAGTGVDTALQATRTSRRGRMSTFRIKGALFQDVNWLDSLERPNMVFSLRQTLAAFRKLTHAHFTGIEAEVIIGGANESDHL